MALENGVYPFPKTRSPSPIIAIAIDPSVMVNGTPVIRPASYAPIKANTTPKPPNTATCIPMSPNPIPLVAFVNGTYPIPKTRRPSPITASASDPFIIWENTTPNIAVAIPKPTSTAACSPIASKVGAVAATANANIL